MPISYVVRLTNEAIHESNEFVIEAVIDELIEEGSLVIGFAQGYERGVMSAKGASAKKPLVILQPLLAQT